MTYTPKDKSINDWYNNLTVGERKAIISFLSPSKEIQSDNIMDAIERGYNQFHLDIK